MRLGLRGPASGPALPEADAEYDAPEQRRPKVAWGPWGRPLRRIVAVAAVVIVVGLGFTAHAAWTRHRQQSFAEQNLRVVVSAPRDLMQGATGTFTVQTTDLRGQVAAVPARWELRREGEVVANGVLAAAVDGAGRRTVRWPVAEMIPDEFRVVVDGPERVETHSLRLDPMVTQPILHVATDKPIYRPGDVVRLRCVALDRVTLEPVAAGWGAENSGSQGPTMMPHLRIDVRDPTGTNQQQVWAQAVQAPESVQGAGAAGRTDAGVWQGEFVLSSMAAGGKWKLAAHGPGVGNQAGDRIVEYPLRVTRAQAPRLAKRLRLDRESYAPGQTVAARLAVQRLGGGSIAGAAVTGRVVVGGETVAQAEATVDAAGSAAIAFVLPDDLSASSGRVVLTVDDNAVVESVVETFALPLDRLEVQAYPEGGDLVAGHRQRTYFEITDPSGRPVDARGRIVDDLGATVAPFETEHQGRGRVAFTAAAGREYRLLLEEPMASEHLLPTPKERRVALAVDPVAGADHLRVTVRGEAGVPRLVAAYCRGAMVGQAAMLPGGSPTLELPVRPRSGGGAAGHGVRTREECDVGACGRATRAAHAARALGRSCRPRRRWHRRARHGRAAADRCARPPQRRRIGTSAARRSGLRP